MNSRQNISIERRASVEGSKHIWAVELNIAPREKVASQVVITPINVWACTKCESDSLVKHGSMASLRETKNHIKTTKTLAVSVQKGSLIDFETTGRPRIEREHEVITLGYVHGNKLVIIQQKTR